jgi:hypothetical protein
VVLCVNRIPTEQKNRFPEVLCVFSNTAGANIRQFVLCGNGAPERTSCGLLPPCWSKLLCGKSSS